MTIHIPNQVLSAADWKAQQTEVLNQVPPKVPESLTEKIRWLQCIVRNATDFPLIQVETTYDSGRSQRAPRDVDPFSLGYFTCCNGDNTLLQGVSGGSCYKLHLDSSNSVDISIGFTNPFIGTYKAAVVESNNPLDGYEAATGGGGSFITEQSYQAQDKEGREIEFKIRVLAFPNEEYPEFHITELRS